MYKKLVAIALTGMIGFAAQAEDEKCRKGSKKGGPGGRQGHMMKMAEELGLTEDQKTQIKDLMEVMKSSGASDDKEARREIMKSEMSKILTPEQQEKMKEMRSKCGKGPKGKNCKKSGDDTTIQPFE